RLAGIGEQGIVLGGRRREEDMGEAAGFGRDGELTKSRRLEREPLLKWFVDAGFDYVEDARWRRIQAMGLILDVFPRLPEDDSASTGKGLCPDRGTSAP